jgi:hypothetical protein
VLHFFLEKEKVTAYFNLLKMVLKPIGFVIIAVYAKKMGTISALDYH